MQPLKFTFCLHTIAPQTLQQLNQEDMLTNDNMRPVPQRERHRCLEFVWQYHTLNTPAWKECLDILDEEIDTPLVSVSNSHSSNSRQASE